MPDEQPEASEPSEERPPITARGALRPYPSSEPYTTWAPDPEPAEVERREVGDLEQRSERRRREGVRRVLGLPSLQAVGWSLLFLGGLIYLHGLWLTSNAVLAGRSDPEQLVSLGGFQILQGTLGLTIAAIGLVLGLVFTFLPVRHEARPVPGTLEFEVAAENLLRGRWARRILIWCGVFVFLVGLALSAYVLRESIARGELYRLSLGGVGYRVHLLGFFLAALGLLVALPLALAQGTVERAAALAEGALRDGRVRRAVRADPWSDAEAEEREAPPERVRPGRAPEERRTVDWLKRADEDEEVPPERRLRPPAAPAEEGTEADEKDPEEDARRWPPS